ncbi:Pectate lyase E [Fulvia fulva]|uniref:Pectate lyase n=1 Tax=Passalora fulva TaxID=5499 RepID=A0A9Q8PC44_PASFU|nr:Pectate lyase E [Fulvia fulva]KAK4620244.1 Pectate lyase E [Fulvia fulva]UJO19725.1 Pectate lyase E [Fulvia fulva]WPV32277.1 Pectate lyase E [Fulvia fulva]
MLFTLTLLAATAIASPLSDLEARAFSFPIPSSKGSVTYSSAQSISGTFDGGLKTYGRGLKTYGRGVSCTGDAEGGDKDAVFLLADGATLKNAIVGADQIEGVHCLGTCTIENVWWTDVCEDALSIKGNGNAKTTGGGARNADDKYVPPPYPPQFHPPLSTHPSGGKLPHRIVQHNGIATVTINSFSAQTFGKLSRSCGNCPGNGKARTVVIKNVKASGGSVLAGVNSNYGDTATIESSTCATSVKQICNQYTGNNSGAEPPLISWGPSSHCKYSTIAAC